MLAKLLQQANNIVLNINSQLNILIFGYPVVLCSWSSKVPDKCLAQASGQAGVRVQYLNLYLPRIGTVHYMNYILFATIITVTSYS
jgi:hypothetical protein